MVQVLRRIRVGVVASALLLAAGTSALAQEFGMAPMFDRPLAVGVILPPPPADPAKAPLAAAVAKSALDGAAYGDEDFKFNGEIVGFDFSVNTVVAGGAVAVTAAANKLLDEGVFGLMGGFTVEEVQALSKVAKQRNVPYINVGVASDSLRATCEATTYHLAPSAAMYLDAIVGWYVRSGYRQWYFIHEDTAEGKAQYDRLKWSMNERHFGAKEAGKTVLKPGAAGGTALTNSIRRSGADVIVLLTGAEDQLRLLAELDKAGIATPVAGYPSYEAQSRAFYAASRKAAPTLGTAFRATAWEGTIDAYGAREWNARFLLEYRAPMESPGWAIYHGVKTLYEAAFFTQSDKAADLLRFMNDQDHVFDLHKGVGTTFRPWDHQMRQSLFLVKINAKESAPIEGALLVGELPAIYMPGTQLNERLDQLGDLASRNRCPR